MKNVGEVVRVSLPFTIGPITGCGIGDQGWTEWQCGGAVELSVIRAAGLLTTPDVGGATSSRPTYGVTHADIDNDGDQDLLTGEIRHFWAGGSSDASELLENDGSSIYFLPRRGLRISRQT